MKRLVLIAAVAVALFASTAVAGVTCTGGVCQLQPEAQKATTQKIVKHRPAGRILKAIFGRR